MRDHHTDTPGLIGDLIRRGVIASVDLAAGMATVTLGEITTAPLRWFECAGAMSTWFPPSVGEQVFVICPEADIAAAVIMRGIYSDANPPPVTGLKYHIKLPDGTTLQYDPATHVLAVVIAAGGKMTVSAPGGAEITGPLIVTGDVTVTGKIDASGDVKAGTISLQTHKHGGVTSGPSKTLVSEP